MPACTAKEQVNQSLADEREEIKTLNGLRMDIAYGKSSGNLSETEYCNKGQTEQGSKVMEARAGVEPA
ncbi:MAG: hypothetical protein CVU15_03515 [Betaproteobacteria bacterium HGW-Betaproteobacteria-1]|nr:MAG: hypothetical protein CVU15_03515 [Betaproteobacteria bacterium HGW-Betaproteobacteria-1]